MNTPVGLIRHAAGSTRLRTNLLVAVLSSAGNFALSLSLMHRLDSRGFGLFALAFAAYVFLIGLIRSAFLDPLFAVLSRDDAQVRDQLQRITLIGLVAGAGLVFGWALTGRSSFMLILALAFPGIALYEAIKACSGVLSRPLVALVMESTWCAISLAASGMVWQQVISPALGFAFWAFGCTTVGLASVVATSVSIRPRWGTWGVSGRDLGFFVVDFVAGAGSAQLTIMLLAITVSTSGVGQVRAAATLLSPIAIVASVASSLMIPFLTRQRQATARRQLGSAASVAALLVATTAPLMALPLLMPRTWLGRIVGGEPGLLRILLAWLALEMAFGLIASVPFAGHRALLAGRESATRRVLLGAFRIITVVAASLMGGVTTAVAAMAFVSAVSAAVWWQGYARLVRRDQHHDVPARACRRVWIFTDERIDLAGDQLVSRTAVTGAFLDLLRSSPDPVTIVCRPCNGHTDFRTSATAGVAVQHLADWRGAPGAAGVRSIRRHVRSAISGRSDVLIAVMPTISGLALGLTAVGSGEAKGRLITLNRGYLSDSVLLRLPRGSRSVARIPLTLVGRATAWVNRRSAQPLFVSRALADAVAAPVGSAICPEIDWPQLDLASAIPTQERRGVLFVGRLEVEKNPLLVAEAVALLPGVPVTFAGAGSQLEIVRAHCEQHGVDATFLGAVGHDEALRLMARAQVAVIPSRTEAFGLVAFEASAMGCRVVHSGVGGLAEAAAAAPDNAIVDGWDPQVWATAIGHALHETRTTTPDHVINLSPQAAGWVRLPDVVSDRSTHV